MTRAGETWTMNDKGPVKLQQSSRWWKGETTTQCTVGWFMVHVQLTDNTVFVEVWRNKLYTHFCKSLNLTLLVAACNDAVCQPNRRRRRIRKEETWGVCLLEKMIPDDSKGRSNVGQILLEDGLNVHRSHGTLSLGCCCINN